MIRSARTRRISHGLAVAVCLAALLSAASNAYAADTSTRSATEIRARWQQLRPVHSGSPYLVAPNLSAPFAAGSLNDGFLQDGLHAINYARYLAGLPDDVVLDATYTDRAQHGAVLLAVGQFAHSQPQPSTMATSFYTIANGATSSSNIGWGYGTLWDFNAGCLADDDTGNIDRVGHRRWLLNPAFKKTGMGMASGRTDTFVFDWSRTSEVVYDSVKWPCSGLFPTEMFGTQAPWSITLNPAQYSWTSGTAGHTVTLRRARDGRVWTFTSADTDKGGEYFNFETSGYGVSNCFIFRPDPASVGSYQVGDVFEVTLAGGITHKSDGTPATVSYQTQFISQSAGFVITPTSGEHGAISPSGVQNVASGGSQTFTITPAAGYHVADVLVDGSSVGAVQGYTFSNVTVDHTIAATFAVDTSAVTLSSESATALPYGSVYRVRGTLTGGGEGLAGYTVTLQTAAPGGAYRDTSLVATTTSGGAFSFAVKPVSKTHYRVRFAGADTYSASRSATSVFARPRIKLLTPVAPKTMWRSDRYSVHGYLKPWHASGTYPVRIYRWKKTSSGKWKSYGCVKAKASNSSRSAYTKYSSRVRLPYAGTWKVRAYAPADLGHAATWSSGFDYVKVR